MLLSALSVLVPYPVDAGEGIPLVRRELSIRERAGELRGQVRGLPQIDVCEVGVTVVLQRKTAEGWVKSGRDETNEGARYRIPQPPRPGALRTTVPRLNTAEAVCTAATSRHLRGR
jgi:hypothetical protein